MLVSYSWIKMVITVGILMCVFAYLFLFSSFEMTSDANRIQAPEGLKVNGRNFTLKREKFRIMSGSMHYFRIPFRKWSDRLLKLKAMGLNTVDIYIPWNLHEPEPGYFDFSSDQLNLSEFLYLLQGYGLYAIIRPGPYICAELDLGGLPSWLLRDKNMKLRSLYPGFIEPVERYFKQLFAILQPFQFSYGGPIIAFQIENEYGVYDHDSNYMKYLKEIYISNGLSELFFVCDNKQGLGKYKLEGVLQTINFMWLDAKGMIDKLEAVQPDKPVFVTELWDGWFDHWGENHHIVKTADAALALEYVIKRGASFNLYMFHGGTNFGFINGANANNDGLNYQSTITSYDYDAPVSETGRLSQKFEELKLTIKNNAPKGAVPKTLPWIPDDSPYTGYGMIKLTTQMDLSEILKHVNFKKYQHVVNMENLSINNNAGQSFGYIVYENRFQNTKDATLFIEEARDFILVEVENNIIYSSYDKLKNIKIPIKQDSGTEILLRIFVENSGRVNYGLDLNNQRKGLLGKVMLNNNVLTNWKIYPLEFKKDWLDNVTTNGIWKDIGNTTHGNLSPKVYKGNLYVHKHAPSDTSILVEGWFKGCVFINGFNLGRYWDRGPQKTLYVPDQILSSGENTLLLFDLHGNPSKHEESGYPFVSSEYNHDLGEINQKEFLI